MEKKNKQKTKEGAMVGASVIPGAALGVVGASLLHGEEEMEVATNEEAAEVAAEEEVVVEEESFAMEEHPVETRKPVRKMPHVEEAEPDVEIDDEAPSVEVEDEEVVLAQDDAMPDDDVAHEPLLTEPIVEQQEDASMVDADDISIIDDPDFINDADVDEFNLS